MFLIANSASKVPFPGIRPYCLALIHGFRFSLDYTTLFHTFVVCDINLISLFLLSFYISLFLIYVGIKNLFLQSFEILSWTMVFLITKKNRSFFTKYLSQRQRILVRPHCLTIFQCLFYCLFFTKYLLHPRLEYDFRHMYTDFPDSAAPHYSFHLRLMFEFFCNIATFSSFFHLTRKIIFEILSFLFAVLNNSSKCFLSLILRNPSSIAFTFTVTTVRLAIFSPIIYR